MTTEELVSNFDDAIKTPLKTKETIITLFQEAIKQLETANAAGSPAILEPNDNIVSDIEEKYVALCSSLAISNYMDATPEQLTSIGRRLSTYVKNARGVDKAMFQS